MAPWDITLPLHIYVTVFVVFAKALEYLCTLRQKGRRKNFEKETGMKSRHVTKNMTGTEREMARKEKLVLVILLYGAAVISRHQYMSDMISRIYAND